MGRIDAITEGRLMYLIFPDGADVHVTIGNPPNLTVRGAVVAAPVSPRYSDGYPRHSGRPLLKGLVATMVLGVAFVAGTYAARPPAGAGRPAAPAREAALPPSYSRDAPLTPEAIEELARRFNAPRDATGAGAGQIPEQFTQQLRQPPTVIPPPGQAAPTPAGGQPRKNPFGLED
jgi:hypothetical protein